MVVARLGVSISHGSEELGIVRRIFQQLGEQIARLLELLCLGRFAGSLIGELLAQIGIGFFCRLQQNGNRLRIILGAPIKVDGRADHSENLGILPIKRGDILLGRCEVLPPFV